jgi:hypothetical protein
MAEILGGAATRRPPANNTGARPPCASVKQMVSPRLQQPHLHPIPSPCRQPRCLQLSCSSPPPQASVGTLATCLGSNSLTSVRVLPWKSFQETVCFTRSSPGGSGAPGPLRRIDRERSLLGPGVSCSSCISSASSSTSELPSSTAAASACSCCGAEHGTSPLAPTIAAALPGRQLGVRSVGWQATQP